MSQEDPIRVLRDLVQQRLAEGAGDFSPKARQILSELFGKVVDHLRDLRAGYDNLDHRLNHPQEGPHGMRYPKA